MLARDQPDAGSLQLRLGLDLIQVGAGEQVPVAGLDRPTERFHLLEKDRELAQAVDEGFPECQHRRARRRGVGGRAIALVKTRDPFRDLTVDGAGQLVPWRAKEVELQARHHPIIRWQCPPSYPPGSSTA